MGATDLLAIIGATGCTGLLAFSDALEVNITDDTLLVEMDEKVEGLFAVGGATAGVEDGGGREGGGAMGGCGATAAGATGGVMGASRGTTDGVVVGTGVGTGDWEAVEDTNRAFLTVSTVGCCCGGGCTAEGLGTDDEEEVTTLCRSVIHCDLELIGTGAAGGGAITGAVLDTSDMEATELAVAHTACLFTEDEAAWVRACADACATIEGGICQAGFDGMGAAITATGFDAVVLADAVDPAPPVVCPAAICACAFAMIALTS